MTNSILYAVYFVWVLVVIGAPTLGPFFAFAPSHTVLSAFFGVTTLILGFFSGMSLPFVLIPFFTIEFIVFLMSKRGGWFEGYERCMTYFFRSSMIPFAAVIVLAGYELELMALPFVVVGIWEGIYVIFQKLVDTGKIKVEMKYNIKVGRYVGTIGNPNHVSEYLLVSLVILVFVAQKWPVIFLGVPFIFLGLVFTAGRATIVSLAAGGLLLSFFYPVSLFATLPLVGFFAWWMRKRKFIDENRLLFWKEILKIKKCHPFKIEGMGVQIYTEKMEKLKRHHVFNSLDRSHNWFIDIFVEGGVWYLIPFVSASIAGLIFLPPILKCALLILLVSQFFSFPFQANYMTWIFLVSVGSLVYIPYLWVLGILLIPGLILGIRAILAGRQLTKKTESLLDVVYNARRAMELDKRATCCLTSRILKNNSGILKKAAIPELDKLLDIPAGVAHGELMANLAETYMIVGEVEKAKQAIEKGLPTAPGNVPLRRFAGLIDGRKEHYYAVLLEITKDFLASGHKKEAIESQFWLDLVLNSPDLEHRKTHEKQYLDRFGKSIDELLKNVKVANTK